ncbi:hypothetical protein ACI741_22285 [Escherichia coli]
MYFKNYDFFANEVRVQAERDNIINWSSLSWGKGVAFKKFSYKINDINMGEHFQQLAKVLIYRECFPNVHKSLIYLTTIKLMEYSYMELNVDLHIVNLNSEIIFNIVDQAEKHYSINRACAIEKTLKEILEVLATKNIINPRLSRFNTRLRGISNKSARDISEQNNVKKKLPEDDVIDFIGRVFRSEEKSERDIFTTSIIALLLCAPTRISEIINLEVDCEVEGTDSEGKATYGIRYFCAKGYGDSIKWIPSNMKPIARLAIQRLKNLSHTARAIAAIRENGELEFYNLLGTEPEANDFYTKLCDILNIKNKNSFNIRTQNVLAKVEEERISAKEFWNEVLNNEEKTDHWNDFFIPTKLSNKLLLLAKDQLHMKKGSDLFHVAPATKKLFFADFKKRSGAGKDSALNFFQRHKSLQPDGMKEVFRSHQPRHLLNTLAQRAMLSEVEIAFWSGRRSVEQNSVYDNRSWEELRNIERKVLFSEEMLSDLGEGVRFELIAKIKENLESLRNNYELYKSQHDNQRVKILVKEIKEIDKIINHIIRYYNKGDEHEQKV